MQKRVLLWLCALPLMAGVYACSEWQGAGPTAPAVVSSTAEQPGANPVVTFGRPETGSPFPPPEEHDQSGHAKDNLNPRTVVIDVGQRVTFQAPPNVHQIAIYFPGKDPKDVNTTITKPAPAGCPGVPLIDDPVLRLTAQERPCGVAWTYTQQFNAPGRYLVICRFLLHFEVGMYGWVEVREPKL